MFFKNISVYNNIPVRDKVLDIDSATKFVDKRLSDEVIIGHNNKVIWFPPLKNWKQTLPEAQWTQGIESITWIMFLTEFNLKSFWLEKIIQVTDSIPWVRCASGNVYVDGLHHRHGDSTS